jgi:GMP synthase (glutamine-hydrolysing)
MGVYSEIHAYDMGAQAIRDFAPKAIILSGGPETVTAGNTPRAPDIVFEMGVPVLGICYGMQTMAEQLGGKVEGSHLLGEQSTAYTGSRSPVSEYFVHGYQRT